jgi:cellulose synthase/poly-beta-1,6-N-acetylglucosamine synthase-like glycosyltransferase
MDDRPARDVSLVVTVLNEAGSVGTLLASIAAQTIRPREVIVVDGGSRDGTQLHVEWWHGRLGCPLRLIEVTGTNIAQGRNRGIAAARAPLIAVTDAGVRLEPDWLAQITAPFDRDAVAVVAGFFVPVAETVFELAMGATVLPALSDVDPTSFLPSSRSVAFRKAAWESVGGYPEWLDYCEDLVFDLALRDRGSATRFVPDALVHFRPRGSVRAFWRQYFRYARGDGKANLWLRRHLIRYGTYASLIALLAAGKRGKPLWPLALLAGAAYLRRPVQHLWSSDTAASTAQRITATTLIPLIRLTGDYAKMAGYPVGVLWRIRRHGLLWSWRNTT